VTYIGLFLAFIWMTCVLIMILRLESRIATLEARLGADELP
jgi:hypothetical protein